MEIPDLTKTRKEDTNEWLSYLQKLKAEKRELEQEQYTTITLLKKTEEEIEKVEIILDALGEPQPC